MRINVYSQELTREVSLVTKADEHGNVHYGVMLFIRSPKCLHHTPDDDDRSAVTYWLPSCDSFTPADLAGVFRKAASLIESVSVEQLSTRLVRSS